MSVGVAKIFAGFRLSDFLDGYIPLELQANAETHRRARMFMLSHVFGPFLGNTIPLYMYIMGISRDYRAYVFFGSIVMFWVYPILLRLTGRYQLLAFLSVQNLIFCALWACFAYGGMTSPFLPWLLIFPLLAFLYLPPRGWIRNLLLTQIFGSVLSFIAVCLSGYPLPPIEIDDLQTIGMISMASVAIYFAMMSLYFAKMFREQEQFSRELNSLVSTSDNLRNLTDAANQASKAKADFVAGMSHELRTPLNAIIGYSQLLLEEACDEDDEETVTDIGHIHNAGAHLLGLIDNILTYSRIDARMMPVNPTSDVIGRRAPGWLNIPQLPDVASRATLEIAESRVEIVTDWSLAGSIVRQLIVGIAHQHPSDKISVSAAITGGSALCVTLVSRGPDGRVSPVELHSEMFEHGDDASSTKYGSTGIELPLAQELAALLGGSIESTCLAGEPAVLLLLPSTTQSESLAA